MKIKKIHIIALTVFSLANCLHLFSGQDIKDNKIDKTIGVSLLDKNTFFESLVDSMKKEAEKNKYKLVVCYANFKPEVQDSQIDKFISDKVDAIVLTPAHSISVGNAIRRANQADIPVFTCDIACLDKTARVISHIGTDNYKGGGLAAESMMAALKNEGNVVIVGCPDVESSFMREKGFKDALNESHSKIRIIKCLYGNGDQKTGYELMHNYLKGASDFKGVFAINDQSAIGAAKALQEANRKNIAIVGFDASPEGRKAVRDGILFSSVKQSTDNIGSAVIKDIERYFDETKYRTTLIEGSLYTKEDSKFDQSIR